MNGAIYIENSGNSKLSNSGSEPIDCTYTSTANTCPKDCPLTETCYSKLGYTGFTNNRLIKESEGLSALEVAKAEAKVIDSAYKGGTVPNNRNLRLHGSGDSRTVKGTRLINKAVGRWKQRGGGIAWSFTHAWRKVHRKEWNNVSVLASVSVASEAEEARKQGYAPAIVVANHESDKAFKLDGSDTKWIPCPNQTKDNVSCVDCGLCMRTDYLFEANCGIAFAAHGVRKNLLKKQLTVLK